MRTLLVGSALCLLLAADAAQDAAKKDAMQLQGEWKLVSGERNGQPLPEDVVKSATRTFKGDESTVTVNEMVVLRAKITLDPSKKPKTIDYKIADGENEGKTVLGIYEVDGDTAKFCSAVPGATERPKDFSAKEGSNQTLSVWKRAKK
jgi:uncharacterized protein (TIGR03067 family)